MKKVIAALLSIMMLLAGATAFADKLDDIKAAGKLVVGTEATFAPYEFYYTDPETGEEKLCGFEMDLARGIAEELGVELVVSDQAFSGLITALRSGELDCIMSGMSIKPGPRRGSGLFDPVLHRPAGSNRPRGGRRQVPHSGGLCGQAGRRAAGAPYSRR